MTHRERERERERQRERETERKRKGVSFLKEGSGVKTCLKGTLEFLKTKLSLL